MEKRIILKAEGNVAFEVKHEDGEIIIRQGDMINNIYLVLEGNVNIEAGGGGVYGKISSK